VSSAAPLSRMTDVKAGKAEKRDFNCNLMSPAW
jgi:hypothetical protein